MAAIFLVTCLMVVLQLSEYSIFHSRDIPIQLSLLWQSYSCQCLNTETSSISYTISLYIRLVVTASLIINEDNLLLNSISSVQWWHTNQHSLLSQTSSHHLKLWPHGRQTAQHISWNQGRSTSPFCGLPPWCELCLTRLLCFKVSGTGLNLIFWKSVILIYYRVPPLYFVQIYLRHSFRSLLLSQSPSTW